MTLLGLLKPSWSWGDSHDANSIQLVLIQSRMSAVTAIDCDDASDDADDVVVFAPSEFMDVGLRLVNYTTRRIKRAKTKRNIERFIGHFGASPATVAKIWEDLQTTSIDEARVPPSMLNMDHYLMALHHLKRYPTDLEREAIFDVDGMRGRQRVWYYVGKIRQLKKEKIVWPADNFGSDLWVISVDGVHFWIEEPQHPEWSQDREYYSHKYNKAGLCYELGISLSESKLVWMNGKFKAGRSDNSIFQKEGLMQKLVSIGKRAIGDGNYVGNPKVISTPNNHDSTPVKLFKSRALKRHEKFNGMIKHFDCLIGRFRHSAARFEDCVEAVCVICQYKLEMGRPLFDILIPAVVDKIE